jgi:hypothetical protein
VESVLIFASKHTALKVLYVHRSVYMEPPVSSLPTGNVRPSQSNPKALQGVNGDFFGMDFKQDEIGGDWFGSSEPLPNETTGKSQADAYTPESGSFLNAAGTLASMGLQLDPQ